MGEGGARRIDSKKKAGDSSQSRYPVVKETKQKKNVQISNV